MSGPTMFRRTRLGLTIVYGTIIGLILLLMTAVFYFLLAHAMAEREDDSLRAAHDKAIDSLAGGTIRWRDMKTGELMNFSFKSYLYVDWSFLSSDEFAFVTRDDQSPFFASLKSDLYPNEWAVWMTADLAAMGGAETASAEGAPASRSSRHFAHASSDGRTYKMTATSIRDIGDGFEYLYLGEDTTEDTRLLARIRTILLALGFGLLLVASGLGYAFAGRAMVPVERAFRKLRDFTADASHELRTPITVLQASVEVLQEQRERLPPFHRETLDGAREEIGRMAALVDHLLILARSDAGTAELMREPVELTRLAQESVRAMQWAAAAKRVTLRIDAAPEADVRLIGDSQRIHQLIIILLDNAIKYNKPGGTVSLTVRQEGKGAAITVEDSGTGIPEECLPRIFERFYRVDKARARIDNGGEGVDLAGSGTGLGLAIADWIASAHRGSITAKSELGAGSRFVARFPGG